MWTFRSGDFSGTAWPGGVGDKTTWVYEDATGLLLQKLDAQNQGPIYTYGPGGRLTTRTWARGGTTPLVTTYGYDGATGELLSVNYSDPGTPDIAYTYDRLGRQKTVTDAVGMRTFSYDPDTLQLVSEDINGTNAFDGVYDVKLIRKYEPGGSAVAGRSTGFQIGETPSYDVTYGYDGVGRFDGISWNAGGAVDAATYSYVPSSNLLAGMTTTSGQATSYGYEPLRDLKTQVQNSFGGSVVSQYDYRYDELGRRTDVVTSGSAFGGTGNEELSLWGYNDRNELTTSNRHAGTNPDVPGAEAAPEKRWYNYDPIGNRVTASAQDGSTEVAYTPDSLNQYDLISDRLDPPQHDLDGNMEQDGTGKILTYNGENRLVGFSDGTTTVSYVYDYIGRRVMKTVGAETRTFVYDGWNMVREDVDADGAGPGAPVSKHQVWGLDLSQSMQGAGGIGGLVAVVDSSSGDANLFAFDGNGNVSEVVVGGVVDAHYEYDAFGNVVPGTGGGANPWQFSTKYVDGESGYSYYGYRYYDGLMGRWTRRDPIGEVIESSTTDGEPWQVVNPLYLFVDNEPTSELDILGLVRVGIAFLNGDNDAQNQHFLAVVRASSDPNRWRGVATGQEMLDFMRGVCTTGCGISLLTYAGHGWRYQAGEPDQGGPGLPGAPVPGSPDRNGFYSDIGAFEYLPGPHGGVARRSVVSPHAATMSDLRGAIAAGEIRFQRTCTIQIHSCRVDQSFSQELRQATGCRVIAPSGGCAGTVAQWISGAGSLDERETSNNTGFYEVAPDGTVRRRGSQYTPAE